MKPLIVIGTRPEAIKLAPVCLALPEADVACTGQHSVELIAPILEHFGIRPTRWPAAQPRLSLADSANHMMYLANLWAKNASCVIAQGDTTTAAMAGMAAFYHGIPFVHVEAGLRTYREVPYPEEFNRRACALAAKINCAPTQRAAENLRGERVPGQIVVTGNTVADAMRITLETMSDVPTIPRVLVTCHRRENFGEAFENVCNAVCRIAHDHSEVRVMWAVHPNPNARPKAMPGVELIDPPSYPDWVWLMKHSSLILTDSGGIQEEAAILGKKCLVLRDLTERPEAVECGACRMVGTDPLAIVEAANAALSSEWSMKPHPFGDGHAAERIATLVRELT